jgi:hypothetical protein
MKRTSFYAPPLQPLAIHSLGRWQIPSMEESVAAGVSVEVDDIDTHTIPTLSGNTKSSLSLRSSDEADRPGRGSRHHATLRRHDHLGRRKRWGRTLRLSPAMGS